MNKNTKRAFAVLGIVFITFSIIIFVLPFDKNEVFWVSYGCAFISLIVQGYSLYAGFGKGVGQHSKLYGFPIVRIGTIYMIAQFALSLIAICLSEYIPIEACIIVFVLMLAVASIGLIATDAVKEELEHQDIKFREEVYTIREIQSKVRMVVGLCDDEKTKKLLSKFYDELHYSDPMSRECLFEVENELSALIDEMQRAVVEKEYEAVQGLTETATVVLSERNRLCKLNK